MSDSGETVDSLDIFEDRVDAHITQLVAYVRQFLQAAVDEYNRNLQVGQEPKCVICELEDYMEELSIKLTGTTHVANETHDAYHDMLYKQHGFSADGT